MPPRSTAAIGVTGHLFQNRFKSIVVEEERYLLGPPAGAAVRGAAYGSGQRVGAMRATLQPAHGKGAKGRVTMLPEPLADPLRRHLEQVKVIHEKDVRDGWGRVAMPEALDRKYPNAPSEWLSFLTGMTHLEGSFSHGMTQGAERNSHGMTHP